MEFKDLTLQDLVTLHEILDKKLTRQKDELMKLHEQISLPSSRHDANQSKYYKLVEDYNTSDDLCRFNVLDNEIKKYINIIPI